MSIRASVPLSARLKRWIGPAAYVIAGTRTFIHHPTFHARIDSPAGSTEGRVHQVVGNGWLYGGILVARESTFEGGLFVFYTLGLRSRWHLLRAVALLRFRVPLPRPGDIFLQTPAANVETRPTGPRVDLDGEIRTRTPVAFEVMPGGHSGCWCRGESIAMGHQLSVLGNQRIENRRRYPAPASARVQFSSNPVSNY